MKYCRTKVFTHFALRPSRFSLFPNQFQAPLGPIPNDWQMKTLREIAEKPQSGYTESASGDAVGPRFLRTTDINKTPWVDWNAAPYCSTNAKSLENTDCSLGTS